MKLKKEYKKAADGLNKIKGTIPTQEKLDQMKAESEAIKNNLKLG